MRKHKRAHRSLSSVVWRPSEHQQKYITVKQQPLCSTSQKVSCLQAEHTQSIQSLNKTRPCLKHNNSFTTVEAMSHYRLMTCDGYED